MKTKPHKTTHEENLARLARIEGQVRGVRRMVEEGSYCIDIAIQLQAIRSALSAVERRILHKHLDHCVADAVTSRSKSEADEKVKEVLKVMKSMCR